MRTCPKHYTLKDSKKSINANRLYIPLLHDVKWNYARSKCWLLKNPPMKVYNDTFPSRKALAISPHDVPTYSLLLLIDLGCFQDRGRFSGPRNSSSGCHRRSCLRRLSFLVNTLSQLSALHRNVLAPPFSPRC